MPNPCRGGYAISLAEKKLEENERFTCPNASCGKVFDKPLKAVDLHLGPETFYDACPHCLSKIAPSDKKTQAPLVEKERKHHQETSSCSHHFGYLCERTAKGNVPEECLVCKDMVDCILKTMKR